MKIKWPSLFKNNAPYFTNPSIFMEKIWTPTFFENFENSTLLLSPLYKRWGRGKGGEVPTVDRGISYNKGLLLVVYNIQTEFKANFSCRSIYNLFTIALTHWHTEFWWVIFLALTVWKRGVSRSFPAKIYPFCSESHMDYTSLFLAQSTI